MNKKLPNIYKGKVNNNSVNQKQSIFFKKDKKINEEKELIDTKDVNSQIKDVFRSPNFVYKADVSIQMNDGQFIKKTIIGRTNNSLITMDDELIDVSKISQINFLN